MAFTDHALTLQCEGLVLTGILSTPAMPMSNSGIGVIVVVGGPQYRIGSHRQFVLMARRMAAAGHACLRFDCRGMGDSEGEQPGFEGIDADIHAAISALRTHVPWVHRIVLWGLCDGASASLLYLHRRRSEANVHALCLLNPWVRSEASLARTHVKHYYADRLRQRSFWLKLLRGGIAIDALRSLLRNLRGAMAGPSPADTAELAPFPVAMARAWKAFDGPLLLVLSGKDLTAKEFEDVVATDPEWVGALDQGNVRRECIAAADHTFSQSISQQQLEEICLDWLSNFASPKHHERKPEIPLPIKA